MDYKDKLNVLKKIHNLQKQVKGLEIDTQGHGYKYLSGAKLLGVIRPLMDEFGILLLTELLEVEYREVSYETKNGSKTELMAMADILFTWVDIESGESIEQRWKQNAMNGWDKSVGALLTYSERYFLMKTLKIQTDSDDLETIAREKQVSKKAPGLLRDKLEINAKRKGVDLDKILSRYKKDEIYDMTEVDINDALARLETIRRK